MTAFETCPADVIHVRASRRKYLIRAFRGWLTAERHPRWMATLQILGCIVVAVAAGFACARCGLRSWSARAFWGVLSVWPVYLGMARWQAAREYGFLDLHRDGRSYVHAAERAEAARLRLYSDHTESDFRSSACRAMGEGIGRGGPIVILVAGSLTFGLWLLWQLIQEHSDLVAQIMVDADYASARTVLVPDFEERDWRAEAVGGTALYFMGIATAVVVFAWVLPYLLPR